MSCFIISTINFLSSFLNYFWSPGIGDFVWKISKILMLHFNILFLTYWECCTIAAEFIHWVPSLTSAILRHTTQQHYLKLSDELFLITVISGTCSWFLSKLLLTQTFSLQWTLTPLYSNPRVGKVKLTLSMSVPPQYKWLSPFFHSDVRLLLTRHLQEVDGWVSAGRSSSRGVRLLLRRCVWGQSELQTQTAVGPRRRGRRRRQGGLPGTELINKTHINSLNESHSTFSNFR